MFYERFALWPPPVAALVGSGGKVCNELPAHTVPPPIMTMEAPQSRVPLPQ